jgi:hypothetical protein
VAVVRWQISSTEVQKRKIQVLLNKNMEQNYYTEEELYWMTGGK